MITIHPARRGRAALPLAREKRHQAEMWASAPRERVEYLLAPVHAHLLRALRPGRGLRWFDLGTDTGARCSPPGVQ